MLYIRILKPDKIKSGLHLSLLVKRLGIAHESHFDKNHRYVLELMMMIDAGNRNGGVERFVALPNSSLRTLLGNSIEILSKVQ